MEKIILGLIPIVLFFSCDLAQDIYLTANLFGKELYYIENCNAKTFTEIADYINKNVEYYHYDYDEYQNPEKTIKTGKGDCEDMVILFMNIAYFNMGIELEFGSVDTDRAIIGGGVMDHAVVFSNGKTYNAQSGKEVDYFLSYVHSFETVFCF